MLPKKQKELLELARRIEIGYARDYAILTEAKEYTAVRKRLAALCKEGYMLETWRNGKKAYYLSSAGLSIVDSNMKKTYNPGGQTTDHALYTAEFAALMCLRWNLASDSVVFDRDMMSIKELKQERSKSGSRQARNEKVHAPDFAIGSKCFEVELNQKSKTRLRSNFAMNAKVFDEQIWLVPSRLKSLRRTLKELSRELKAPAKIYTVEKLEEDLSDADPKREGQGRHISLKIKPQKPTRNIMEELQ